MATSDTDYFQINYYASKYGTKSVDLIASGLSRTNGLDYIDYIKYSPPVQKVIILNNNYDSVTIIENNTGGSVISKSKLGVIKIITPIKVYELIK